MQSVLLALIDLALLVLVIGLIIVFSCWVSSLIPDYGKHTTELMKEQDGQAIPQFRIKEYDDRYCRVQFKNGNKWAYLIYCKPYGQGYGVADPSGIVPLKYRYNDNTLNAIFEGEVFKTVNDCLKHNRESHTDYIDDMKRCKENVKQKEAIRKEAIAKFNK